MKKMKISEAEWQVMRVLWQKHPLTAKDVIQALSWKQNWQPKTVKTLLNRLVKKEVLGFKEEKRVYHYFPLISEKECLKLKRLNFLEKIYNGASSSLVAAFIKDNEFSHQEIEELKAILDQKLWDYKNKE